jgi:hypothetical protein
MPCVRFLSVIAGVVLLVAASEGRAGAELKAQAPAPSAFEPAKPSAASMVRNGPDLRIDRVWIARYDPTDPNFALPKPLTGSIRQGQRIAFICDLTNLGPDVRSLWGLGFYVDGTMVWNNSWGPLATNATLRGLGPFTAGAAGAHQLRVVLDYADALLDRVPGNNVATLSFTVLPRLVKKAPATLPAGQPQPAGGTP